MQGVAAVHPGNAEMKPGGFAAIDRQCAHESDGGIVGAHGFGEGGGLLLRFERLAAGDPLAGGLEGGGAGWIVGGRI